MCVRVRVCVCVCVCVREGVRMFKYKLRSSFVFESQIYDPRGIVCCFEMPVQALACDQTVLGNEDDLIFWVLDGSLGF